MLNTHGFDSKVVNVPARCLVQRNTMPGQGTLARADQSGWAVSSRVQNARVELALVEINNGQAGKRVAQ